MIDVWAASDAPPLNPAPDGIGQPYFVPAGIEPSVPFTGENTNGVPPQPRFVLYQRTEF